MVFKDQILPEKETPYPRKSMEAFMTDEKNIKEEEIQQEPVSAEAGGEDLHKTPLEGETPASEEDFQVNEKDKELTKKV